MGKIIRRITNKKGTLSGLGDTPLNVHFSLVVMKDVIDGLDGLRSARGTITFENERHAWDAFNATENLTLRGGGIEASVFLTERDAFTVTGAVVDV